MYATILVSLDGSRYSRLGGQVAVSIAGGVGAKIVACHIYDTELHRVRFRAMEPGLPSRYREKKSLDRIREAHGSLIHDGFQTVSEGYMEHFLADARQAGINTTEVHSEGRNYVKILEIADKHKTDLIVIGAHGIGAIGDGLLGSTAARVLRHARCDVLIVRRVFDDGGIVVGVDGSEQAAVALQKSLILGRVMRKPLEIVAAYDAGFHNRVFKTMAHSLSAERQEAVGLARQEKLHEELIDGGLGTLYQTFLDRAHKVAESMGITASTALLEGKAYWALFEHLKRSTADLLVVGRHGYHQEKISGIGSNAEAVARRSKTNVLVTMAREGDTRVRETQGPVLEWDSDALERLERIPFPWRSMVRQRIDKRVLAEGGARVTLEAVLEIARRMGMVTAGKRTPVE